MAISKQQRTWLIVGIIVVAIAAFFVYDNIQTKREDEESRRRIEEILDNAIE